MAVFFNDHVLSLATVKGRYVILSHVHQGTAHDSPLQLYAGATIPRLTPRVASLTSSPRPNPTAHAQPRHFGDDSGYRLAQPLRRCGVRLRYRSRRLPSRRRSGSQVCPPHSTHYATRCVDHLPPTRSPTDPRQLLIKRIIGLPGSIVTTLPPHAHRTVRVPAGHCWVEGDERYHSRDSNAYGPIPLGLVNARVVGVVWPPR